MVSEKILKVEVVVNEKNKEVIWNLLNFSMDNNCFFVFEMEEKPTQKKEKPVLSRTEVSKRTKKGMDGLKKSKRAFTQSLYGWDVKKDGTLKPNWKEQEHIDYMRYMYHIERMSAGMVARNLNKRKVKGKRGGKWQSAGVKRILLNDFHKGRNDFNAPKWFIKKITPALTWDKKPKYCPLWQG